MGYYERYVSRYIGDQADPELARKITKAVVNRSLAKIAVPLVITVGMVFAILLLIPLFEHAEESLGIPALVIHGLIVVPIVIGAAFVIWGIVTRASNARKVLHQELLSAGIRPVRCVFCDYELNQSVSEACPECGEELAPQQDRPG